jgi:hypothetical protein
MGAKFNRAFTQYGGASLYRRFATSKDDVTKFLKELVDALVFLEGSRSATVRKRYTYDICYAVTGIIYQRPVIFHMALPNCYSGGTWPFQGAMVVAVAAVGNVDLLRILTSSAKDLFRCDCLFFPNALYAAVAIGQMEALRWMVHYLQTTGSSGAAEHELAEALWVAVRTNQIDAGRIILQSLSSTAVSDSGMGNIDGAVTECMRTGNIELLPAILQYRQTHDAVQVDENGFGIYDQEVDILFQEGSCYGLQELIKKGIIQPHKMGHHLPLDRAVEENRYDLARILLKRGADIDARDEWEGLTVLQYAARRGCPPNVKFLIQSGADPSSVTAKTFHGYNFWKDILSLCEKVTAHAQGAKLDEDAWCRFWQTV